jgi:hypothetical protein
MEPLTIQMTDEQVKRKQEQQRAKAPPPGTSRILSRANRDNKKNQNKPQAVLHQPKLPQDNSTPPKPILTQVNNVEQTINKSNLPSNQNQSQTTSNEVKTESKSNAKVTAIENHQSDIDEWQNLVEELNPGIYYLVKKKLFVNYFKIIILFKKLILNYVKNICKTNFSLIN